MSDDYIVNKHDALIALGITFGVMIICIIVCCCTCNRKNKRKAKKHLKDIEAARNATQSAVGHARDVRNGPPIPLLNVRPRPPPAPFAPSGGLFVPQTGPDEITPANPPKFPQSEAYNPYRPYKNSCDKAGVSSLSEVDPVDKLPADNPYANPDPPINYSKPRSALRTETTRPATRSLTGRTAQKVTWEKEEKKKSQAEATTDGSGVEDKTAKGGFKGNTGLPRPYRNDM